MNDVATYREHTTVLDPQLPGQQLDSDDALFSLLIYHRDGARIVQLGDQPVVVGRELPSDVPIREESLSRRHARFELRNGDVWVEDLGSTNGTWLNGTRIGGRTRMRPGADIRLGALSVSLHMLTSRDQQHYGLDSHDAFLSYLEYELERTQTFHRKLAMLQVRTARRDEGHLSRWCPRVRGLLRRADRIALYSPTAVEILLPERGRDEALELARQIVAARRPDEPILLCGVALFPGSAGSAEELIDAARTAARHATTRAPVRLAEVRGEQVLPTGTTVLRSPAMLALFQEIERLACSLLPVVLHGETGVGKEVVARAIHERSRGAQKPLHCVNCAAIPRELAESTLFGHVRGAFTGAVSDREGVFEAAHGGTVLLDEIGELPLDLQAKLLRVLEEKTVTRVGTTRETPVDVRVIAATHRDLDDMSARGEFRSDLYYRLSTLMLTVPPLRERREEIPALAEHFLVQANEENERRISGVEPAAMELLERFDWPGNVRQLRNVIDRAALIARGDVITIEDLDHRLRARGGPPRSATPAEQSFTDDPKLPFKERVQRFEEHLLANALQHTQWNQTRAAEMLQIPLRTLVFKLRAFGLRKA